MQEMSHMVLMVALARPTPVTRLVLWFVIYMTGRYFAGCETQTSQIKTIPQPRVTMREDHIFTHNFLFCSFFSFLDLFWHLISSCLPLYSKCQKMLFKIRPKLHLHIHDGLIYKWPCPLVGEDSLFT